MPVHATCDPGSKHPLVARAAEGHERRLDFPACDYGRWSDMPEALSEARPRERSPEPRFTAADLRIGCSALRRVVTTTCRSRGDNRCYDDFYTAARIALQPGRRRLP